MLHGRRKTIYLPGGSVGFRHMTAKLVVDDETLVIPWAQQNCPDAVQTVTHLSRSVLAQLFKVTGEIPPAGVHVEPEREMFHVG